MALELTAMGLTMIENNSQGLMTFPQWLPEKVVNYLRHTEEGQSLRDVARSAGVNASTVMRQVRQFENRREDPLLDEALRALAVKHRRETSLKEGQSKAAELGIFASAASVLRRLAEPRSILVISTDMDKAIVMRELPNGKSTRTAVVERDLAQAFILKDYISCKNTGRISTYEITSAGRAALKRLLDQTSTGMAEAADPFAAQHRIWGEREVVEGTSTRKLRVNLAESPVQVLGRRRDKDGSPFLSADLIAAAERLREDFELSQMGPSVTQNWERFLTGGQRGQFSPKGGGGSERAKERLIAALADLGPGLGDIVLRVCCFVEGVEAAERDMGWAARSGKIVLRIALTRLRRHYDETYGRAGPLIG